MKHREEVAFGGSGLERAAELRGGADMHAVHSETIILWRGKPLITQTGLVRVRADHAALRDTVQHAFLGREGARHIFAHDISAWEAPDQDPEEMQKFFDGSVNLHPDLPEDQGFHELRGVMNTLSPRDAELAATARGLFEWHRTHKFCSNCGGKTQAAQAGWQRECADCGRSHFPRTDPVVIMLITQGNNVLLGRSPQWPDQMYSLLAGFVEPGETIEAAVRRETWEEAGIKTGEVRYLASQPWAFPHSLMFGCWGEALTREITLDPVELEDAQWVSKERILAGFAGEETGIQPARKGSIAHFLIRNWVEDRVSP